MYQWSPNFFAVGTGNYSGTPVSDHLDNKTIPLSGSLQCAVFSDLYYGNALHSVSITRPLECGPVGGQVSEVPL